MDTLPGKLVIPTRDQLITQYKRDYLLAVPSVPGQSVDVGTQVDVDAKLIVDIVGPMYANSVIVADNVSRQTKLGDALDADASALGTERRPASSASGFVTIRAATGGVTIPAGTVGVINGLRYKVQTTALYVDLQSVPIIAVDTGAQTNQPAGSFLAWVSPPAGLGPNATVFLAADGSGLTGGGEEESDEELRNRLNVRAGNPPASGNDAEYQDLVVTTPGLGVEQPFTIPGIRGPGTTAVMFTMQADLGESRLPSPVQIAQVRNWVEGQMPASDGALFCAILSYPLAVKLEVAWTQAAPGWTDLRPWPVAADSASVTVVTDSLNFRVTSATTAPVAGTTFGFYDKTNMVWVRKRVLTASFVSGTLYDIVCDTSFGASDTSFTPAVGQLMSPWSDSLSTIVDAVLTQFAGFGPGEQVSPPFIDPGLRQRRSPPSYKAYSSAFTSKFPAAISAVNTVEDAEMVYPTPGSLPYATPVGSPGVSSYLFTLGDLAVYAS